MLDGMRHNPRYAAADPGVVRTLIAAEDCQRRRAAERSWDRSCHGSRFDVDGDVLAGPATAPLQRRDPPR